MRDGGTCPLGNGEMILGDVDEEEFRNALATLPGRSFAVDIAYKLQVTENRRL